MPQEQTKPKPSSERVSQQMAQLGERDTAPEILVRSLLHQRGLRFRLDARAVECVNSRADIIFGPSKVAVYMDGCFWHFCPEHGSVPASNQDFWRKKLNENRERDLRVVAELSEHGWLALRFWEHEDLAEVAGQIERAVRLRRP